MKNQVMTLANALRKAGSSPSAALKRAWAAIKLKFQLESKVSSFYYIKEDGTERYAVGCNRVAPSRALVDRPAAQKPNPLVIRYYDILVNGYRSFRADRLVVEYLA